MEARLAYMGARCPHAAPVEFIYLLAQTMAVPARASQAGMGFSEQARPAKEIGR